MFLVSVVFYSGDARFRTLLSEDLSCKCDALKRADVFSRQRKSEAVK
jgi:hypothetical protein